MIWPPVEETGKMNGQIQLMYLIKIKVCSPSNILFFYTLIYESVNVMYKVWNFANVYFLQGMRASWTRPERQVFQVTSFHFNYGCPTDAEERGFYQVKDHVSCKQIGFELFFDFLNMGHSFQGIEKMETLRNTRFQV